MATTVNLLSDYSALRVNSGNNGQAIQVGGYGEESAWTVSNGTLSIIPTELATKSRYVIRIAPSSTNPITITLPNEEVRSGYGGKLFSFNCKMKSGSAFSVSALLEIVGGDQESAHTQTLPGGLYGAVQSNKTTVPVSSSLQYANITLTVTGHQGNNVFLTIPNLIDDQAFYNNYYVAASRNFLPDFYWEIDSQSEFPKAPYFRLIDILSSTVDESRTKYRELFKFERTELNSIEDMFEEFANSTLTDPGTVREEYILWLSQFTGNKIIRNLTKNDGSTFFDNPGAQRGFTEYQLSESHYGRAAGTREALYQSAQQVLTATKNGAASTKSVAITPQYNNDVWSIRVQTLANETPDSSSGDTSDLVLSALEPARPLGFKIFHTTVDSFSFILNDISFGRLDEIGVA
jgi:hypothetical protein